MSGGYGQESQTALGGGWSIMGSSDAVIDPLQPADPLAAARAELAALEQRLRALQQLYAATQARVAALEGAA